uniref:POC1 centriolar protein-like protein n=1 Tax=Bactrocera dorsalis TaxID=27457 RepID=A0A034VQ58_BACDO
MVTMLITASDDKTLKLWKVAQRKFLTSFTGHNNWVRAAKFSPNGQLIASCGDDKSLRIFDVTSGECVRTFTEERGMGRQIAWHPDGNLVAVALSCNRVKIFDIAEGELIQLYQVHSAPVNDLAFHPNGNFLLTGGDDDTIRLLDLLEGRPIYTLTGHTDKVCAVAFSPDGQHFASAGEDRQLLVWKSNLHTFDANSFRSKQASFQKENSVSSLAAAPHNSVVDTDSKICDDTILIDPRHSVAYKMRDENFQVLDSQYTTAKQQSVSSFTKSLQQHETLDKLKTDANTDSISYNSSSSTSLLHMPNNTTNSCNNDGNEGHGAPSKYF